MSRKIVITGGTGFLGSNLALRLKNTGWDVTVLGRNKAIGAALVAKGLRFVAVDLSDSEALKRIFSEHSHVVHSAAFASPYGSYEAFYLANVVGTHNVVDAALSAGIERLVNISTPSVYFDYRDRIQIRENEPLPHQVTHYGATKMLADEIVATAANKGLRVVSIRPRGIVGPGDTSIFPRMLAAVKAGKFPLFGSGESLVDLTYIDNVVDSILLCLNLGPEIENYTFNITNGEPRTIRDLAAGLFKKLGREVEFKVVPISVGIMAAKCFETFFQLSRRKTEPPLTQYGVGLMAYSQTLDISLAQAKLGYKPAVGLDEGIDRFVSWWLQGKK